MEKDRFMLIHVDKYVYRFKEYEQAESYGVKNCRGNYEFYIIVDTATDVVVYRWGY